jgi:DNA polymerase elongation subunit (family B)
MATLDVLQQSKRLTMLAGNRWQRSLQGGFANRVDWLLMHGFSERGYVLPDLFEDDEVDVDDAASVETAATDQVTSRASVAPTPDRIPMSLTAAKATPDSADAAPSGLSTMLSTIQSSEEDPANRAGQSALTAAVPVYRAASLPAPSPLHGLQPHPGAVVLQGTASPEKRSLSVPQITRAEAPPSMLTKIDPVTGIRLPATPSRSPSSTGSRTHHRSVASSRGRRSDEAGMGTSTHVMRFEGGLVLPPQAGTYDEYLVVLDFKSLYPSMISEFNICLSTVDWAGRADSIGRGQKPSKELRAALRAAEKEDSVARWDPLTPMLDADAYTVVPPIPASPDADVAGAPGAATSSAAAVGGGDAAEVEEAGRGLLPVVMDSLMARRADTKRRLATATDPATRARLQSEQLALKVLANSIFGALGSRWTRFTAIPISALITAQGRKVIMLAKRIAEQQISGPGGKPLRVVYGDTDSILVATGTRSFARARHLASAICAAVNSRFARGTVCLEVQALYARALLVTKKCYVGLEATCSESWAEPELFAAEPELVAAEPEAGTPTRPWVPEPGIDYRLKHTGVFVVRRDWSNLAQSVGAAIIDALIGPGGDIGAESGLGDATDSQVAANRHGRCLSALQALAARVRSGEWSWDELIIYRGLTRAPATYAQERFLQAAVASRMLRSGIPWTVGDAVPFVVVQTPPLDHDDGSVTPRAVASAAEPQPSTFATSEKARHVSETEREELALEPDVHWYLTQQVLQPVSGLLEPVGITHDAIAEALGVSPTKTASGSSSSRRVECPECGNTFASNSTMRRHMRNRHSAQAKALQQQKAEANEAEEAEEPKPAEAAPEATEATEGGMAPEAGAETRSPGADARRHADTAGAEASGSEHAAAAEAFPLSCGSCRSCRVVCADCGEPVVVLDGIRVVHVSRIGAGAAAGDSATAGRPSSANPDSGVASTEPGRKQKATAQAKCERGKAGAAPKPKSCPECGKAFYNHATMLRHFARFHAPRAEDEVGGACDTASH